jgi:hypothetical protein
MLRLLLSLAVTLTLAAQTDPELRARAASLKVYSEFQRVAPNGEVLSQDRGASGPREILSPAVARNGYATFRIIAEPPPGVPYWLYIGLNPEDAVEVTVYREIWEKQGDIWMADRLERVAKLPYGGLVPSSDVPGHVVDSFLLDVRIPANAPVRRIKVEPQMYLEPRWITYPMEVRVVLPQVPALPLPAFGRLADLLSPASATAESAWREFLCGRAEPERLPTTGWTSARQIMLRNARQEVLLGRSALKPADVHALLGASDGPAWCQQYQPPAAGPEQYLKLRDRLVRGH